MHNLAFIGLGVMGFPNGWSFSESWAQRNSI